MKNKALKSIIVLLLCFSFYGIQAQSIYVNKSDGTQTTYNLQDLGSITFNGGNINFTANAETLSTFSLNELTSLTFKNTSGVDENSLSEANGFNVYPNPVNNILNIELKNAKGGYVEILNITGQTIKTTKIDNTNNVIIEVSDLSKGVYLCRYNNEEKTKTIKFIKN